MMEQQIMTFYLGDELYGIDILTVKEVNDTYDLTQVPLSSDYILGLINLRGQIVTLLDLRTMLGYDPPEIGTGRLVILKTTQELSQAALAQKTVTHQDHVGLLVDSIGNVVTCQLEDIQSVPANANAKLAENMLGVISQGDTIIGIINLQQLLEKC
ncbi:MAG: hypothetical protein CSA81_06950 [Acidobacteria bacterium]|nr:MAG: hypothetical protein CSA81_06950 [Acidobacteriota bacterium]PIE90597.1 MAG: hypothetical protein CR997_04980 [Acidobacteriota bacterium]